jgi:hypothetical protein
VFVPSKSPVKVQPKILDIFLEELYAVYMDQESCFSLCGECDMDRLRSISFYSPLNQFWIAARLICSLCEAMAGSLSVATTAVSWENNAVVDSVEDGRKCLLC